MGEKERAAIDMSGCAKKRFSLCFSAGFVLFLAVIVLVFTGEVPLSAAPMDDESAENLYSAETTLMEKARSEVERFLILRKAFSEAYLDLAEERREAGDEDPPSFSSIMSGGTLRTQYANERLPAELDMSNLSFSPLGETITMTLTVSDDEKEFLPYAKELLPTLGGGANSLTMRVSKPYVMPYTPKNTVSVSLVNAMGVTPMATQSDIRWAGASSGRGLVETGLARAMYLGNLGDNITLRTNSMTGSLRVESGRFAVQGKITFSQNLDASGKDIVKLVGGNPTGKVTWDTTRNIAKLDSASTNITGKLVAQSGTNKFLQKDSTYFGDAVFTSKMRAKTASTTVGTTTMEIDATRTSVTSSSGVSVIHSTPVSTSGIGFDSSGNMKVNNVYVTGTTFFNGTPIVAGKDGSKANPWNVWVEHAKKVDMGGTEYWLVGQIPGGRVLGGSGAGTGTKTVHYARRNAPDLSGDFQVWVRTDDFAVEGIHSFTPKPKDGDASEFLEGSKYTGRYFFLASSSKKQNANVPSYTGPTYAHTPAGVSSRYAAAILDLSESEKTSPLYISIGGTADVRLSNETGFAGESSRILVAGRTGEGWTYTGGGGPSYISLKDVPEGLPGWKALLKGTTSKELRLSKDALHASGVAFDESSAEEGERTSSGEASVVVWSEITKKNMAWQEYVDIVRSDVMEVSTTNIGRP